MPSTDLVGQLYDILEQVKCLRDENCQLRAELKHQEIRHRREIELISRRQQSVVDVEKEKGEEVVGEEEEGYRIYQEEPREDENPFVYEEPNLNLQLNVSNIPNLSYTPLTPKKRIKIKQEPYEELSVPLIERFNGPTVPKFTAAKEDSNLIKRDAYIDDSEFARLPTQYSDQSNSPLKSQKFSFSPIKFQESSPVKVPALEDDSIEVIDDSDIEYDLLVKPRNEEEKDRVKVKQEPGVIMKKEHTFTPPCTGAVLSDITNLPSKLTPLQARDYVRNVLKDKFYNDPSFKLLIDDKNPIYNQVWQISDFKPNSNYTKATLKRKIGKTRKEQQEIDRFYKLAGPGIQLKSIQWDKSEHMEAEEEEGEDDDVNEGDEELAYRRQLSQIYDRFPSPPGFNDVDFPTTQEERKRRIETEKVQASRIRSRLKEAMNQKGYLFRENILNEFVISGRLEKKNSFT